MAAKTDARRRYTQTVRLSVRRARQYRAVVAQGDAGARRALEVRCRHARKRAPLPVGADAQ